MTELSKEEMIEMAWEAGFYRTANSVESKTGHCTQHVFALIRLAMQKEREAIHDLWADALQSDLENGMKCLNEAASKELHAKFPELANLGGAIEARSKP